MRWRLRLALMLSFIVVGLGGWAERSWSQERGRPELGRELRQRAEAEEKRRVEQASTERKIETERGKSVERAARDGLDFNKKYNNAADSAKADADVKARFEKSQAEIAERLKKAEIDRKVENLESRSKNRLSPDVTAEGDHTNFKRDQSGKISNYATYRRNEKNPSGFQEEKRVDITGREHTNPDGSIVATPHVHETGKKGVRPAAEGEIPK